MMLNFTQIGFKQMFFFYTPRNHQETTSYLLFSWSIQKEHKLLISFNFMYSSTAFACLLATSPLWPKYGLNWPRQANLPVIKKPSNLFLKQINWLVSTWCTNICSFPAPIQQKHLDSRFLGASFQCLQKCEFLLEDWSIRNILEVLQ